MGSMNEFWVKVQAQLEDTKFKKQMEQLSKKKYKVDVDVSNSGSKKATRDLEQLAYEATHTQTVFGKLKRSVGETFSGNKLAVTAYLATLKAIKGAASDAKTAIVDMDKAVTDLSVAQGQGRDTAANYLKQLNLQAQSIGATTKEVAQSADSWLRQGKSVKETGDLVYDSMILSKLGQIESAKASEYLTSALNGYKKSASEAIDIVDKLTAVDMESVSDAGGLAESMSRTASAASMAGVSMDKLIGMISTVKEVTQASDESVGNMFKSVFSRMNQIKAGKFVDEETGESLNDTEKVLNKIGISMRDTNGQFLSSEKILDEVGSKWKSFDGVTQRAVATAMAGTYQYNKLISLFDNYSKALQYTEVSANSAGTAIDKFNNSYKESLEAKTNTLQASFESMVLDSDMSKVYGSIIEATTALVKFIDKTGALKGTLSGLGAVMGIKAFVTFKTGIHEAYIELNKFKNAMDIVGKSRVSVKNFDKLLLLTNGLSKSQLKMIVSSKALTQAQRQQLLMASGLSQKEAELQLKTWGLARSTTGLTASTTSAKNALGGLWTIIKSNPIGMIGTAVSAGMMIWQKYKSSVEEHEQKMKEVSEELNQTWNDEKSAIDDAISKYDEYNRKLQDNTLSISEVNDVKSQLKDIQDKLIETFGDEAEGIDLVNGKYDEQISKLETISKRKAEEYVAKQANNVESDKDYLNEKLTDYVSFGATHKPWGTGKADLNDGDIANSKIPELLKKYDKLNLIDGDTFGIQVNQGTREEIYNQLVDFYTDLSKIKDDPAVEKFKDGITETINSDDLFDQDKIDKAKESIKNYTEAEILKDDSTRKAYSNLTDAVDKYNQALEDGTGVEDAEKNLLTAKKSAEDSAKGISNAGDVFQDVYNQISGSAPIEIRVKFGTISDEELQQYQDDIKTLKERLGYKLNPSGAEDAKKNSTVDSFVNGLSDDDRTLLINAKLPDNVKVYTKEQLADLLTQLQNQADENSINILPTTLSSAWEQLKASTDDATKGVADDLQDLADKGELTIDTFKDTDGAESYFDGLGISAENAVKYINSLSDKNSQVSAMSKNIKSITEALGSKMSDNMATADAFTGFDATIKGLDSWKEFTTLLGDSTSSMEDCQKAANKLATEYVNNNNTLANLNDTNKDYYISNLTDMGITNARTIVEDKLTAIHRNEAQAVRDCVSANLELNGTKITASNGSDLLANATANEIISLGQEAQQANISADALVGLAWKKFQANKTTITTSGDIKNLADLAGASTELGKALNYLADIKKAATHGMPSRDAEIAMKNAQAKVDALINGGSHANVTVAPSGGTTGTGTSGTGSSSSTKDTPFDKLSDWASQFFDWIEVRLDRLQKKIDSNISKAESKLNDKRYSSATSYYMSAVGGTYEKLYNTQRGRDKYQTQASSYLNQAVSLGAISSSLAKEIKSRVADGSINISKYSSDIQTVISTYKDWIDKAKDCTTAMQTLHDSLRTYAEDLKKVYDAQRDATVSMAETKQTIATGGVQNTSTAKNSALNYNNLVLDTKNKAYSTATRSATSNVNKLAGSANYGLSHGKIANNKKYNTTLNNIKGYIKKRVAIPDSLLAIVAKKNVTLYNRLYMYNLGIENLKTAREEYITAYSANSAEKYNNIADKYKNLDDATNDAMDLYNSKSSNSVYAKNKNSYLDKQKSGYGSIVNRDVSERNKYASAVSSYKKIMSKSARGVSFSALSVKSRSVVRKCVDTAKRYARQNKDIPDTIMGKLSEYVTKGYISSSFLYACINYNNTLESYNQAKAQTEIDKQTQIAQRAEIASQKFSNITTEYDNKRHTYEQIATELNNKMSILEAKGNGASDVWYQRLYTNEQKTNSNLVSKRKELIESLNKSVKNGDIQKYSTEWYDLRSQIDDVTNSIDESTKSLQEYQNQMEQIKWDRIDEGAQKIQNFVDENDFMINELSRRDLTSDDTGGLTKEGDAVAGLHIANYKAYQEQAQSYANAITDINKKLADDPYNQRYIEQKEKLVKSYQDATKAAQDEKFNTIDLMKSGYDALKNHISDLIDKYQDLIDSEKDAYDYANNISEKTKTLSDLRKQLTALSGDTSEESRAKIQQLNVSLKDAEKDLKDTQYDKLISSTKDMLSDFQTDLDDSIHDIIKNLDDEFNELIASIDEKWGTSSETVSSLMGKINYTEQFDKLLGDGGVLNDTKTVLDGILSFCDNMWAEYDARAKTTDTSTNTAGQNSSSSGGKTNGSSSGSSNKGSTSTGSGNGSKPKPTLTAIPADNLTPTAYEKKKIETFISQNKLKATKKREQYGLLNRTLYDNYGKIVMTAAKWKELAQLLGFSTYSESKTSPFWKKMHSIGIKGFKKGSDSIPYDMIANLGENGTELQYDVSKGVLKSVGQSDIIFTAEQAKTLMEFAKNPMAYKNMYTGTAFSMPSVPVNNKVDNDVNISIGDIKLEGVQDPKQLANGIKDIIKNNTGGVRSMIKEDTIGSLSKGYNSQRVKRW